MWTASSKKNADGWGLRFSIQWNATPVSYADVLRRWQKDDEFRSLFLNLLADAPFPEFRWETPPITAKTAQRPFEFVLLESPGLAREPEPEYFETQFRAAKPGEQAIAFRFHKDAIFIAPCPLGPGYAHLAAFVRQAPASQQQAFWSLVGQTMEQRLSDQPVWLSTGCAVPWPHVRLDDRPKFYVYQPYRRRGKLTR